MAQKSNPIYILGINDGHNSTASLLKDGRITASVSEERFNNIKNYIGFPRKSISWVLESAGITAADLALVTYPRRYIIPAFTHMDGVSDKPHQQAGTNLIRKYWDSKTGIDSLLYDLPVLQRPFRLLHDIAYKIIGSHTARLINRQTAQYLGIPVDRIRLYPHHDCHAAAAYFSSPYRDQALIFTLDGEGDFISSTVAVARGNIITRIATTGTTATLSLLYMEMTGYLGMKRNEHEYKVMGMAPYARKSSVDRITPLFEEVLSLNPDNPLTFISKFDSHLFRTFLERNMREVRFDTLSGAVQQFAESLISRWVSLAVKQTRIGNICVGGGVFMNVKVNQKLAEIPGVRNIFPMPSSGDESNAIGACFLAYRDFMKNKSFSISPLHSLYLGPGFTDSEIKAGLAQFRNKVSVTRHQDIEKRIAVLLSRGEIVGRVSGPMEYGARALGNRSLLAHPQHLDAIRQLNDSMKVRDFWMPFAPSIMAEYQTEYISNPKKIPAPYMMITFDSTPRGRNHFPAAMHPYDFTLRPQIVYRNDNPGYHRVLYEFRKLTGIGGVLNTSFNLHGYPIVLGPEAALDVFMKSGLRNLALGNYLVKKMVEAHRQVVFPFRSDF